MIQEPERPWELMQLGNCGSPLETEAGWLVITHGVGPMRRYTPRRAAARPRRPDSGDRPPRASRCSAADDDERDGYVPNVVYSCGSMIHAGHLVLPYGFADVGASVADHRARRAAQPVDDAEPPT